MHADTIRSFDHDDEDLYVLRFDTDDEDGHTLTMGTFEAIRLYNLLRNSHIAEHAAEMAEASASYKRGEGPNGEPRGTWEDEGELLARRVIAYDAYGADLANKARKENP